MQLCMHCMVPLSPEGADERENLNVEAVRSRDTVKKVTVKTSPRGRPATFRGIEKRGSHEVHLPGVGRGRGV